MYIILEILLMENFIINILILYITKLISKSVVKVYYLILGALLASLYSLIFFYPPLLFLSKLHMKFLISLLLIKISFRTKSLKLFMHQVFAFYIVSFIFAGATLGVFYSSNNIMDILFTPIDIMDGFPVIYLIAGIVLATVVAKILFTYHNKKLMRSDFIMDIKIYYKDKSNIVKSLIDTGNSLIDPFTKYPVFLIEYNMIKDLLPSKMEELFAGKIIDDYYLLENILKKLEDEINLKLIPYNSVGTSNGLLLGFRPDFIILDYNGKDEAIRKDVIIGIYSGLLSSDDSYNGLLNYEIQKQGAV